MPQKKYYRISEVSRITGVEPHVLRYWEKEFRQIRPRRVKRQRLYTEKDLTVLREIKRLLYDEGFTITGAKKRLEQYNVKTEDNATPKNDKATIHLQDKNIRNNEDIKGNGTTVTLSSIKAELIRLYNMLS